jgi:hypothetical protein
MFVPIFTSALLLDLRQYRHPRIGEITILYMSYG